MALLRVIDEPDFARRFFPTEAFETYRSYFTHPRSLQGWDLFHKLIAQGFNLSTVDGVRLQGFTVIVDGNDAKLTFTPV